MKNGQTEKEKYCLEQPIERERKVIVRHGEKDSLKKSHDTNLLSHLTNSQFSPANETFHTQHLTTQQPPQTLVQNAHLRPGF